MKGNDMIKFTYKKRVDDAFLEGPFVTEHYVSPDEIACISYLDEKESIDSLESEPRSRIIFKSGEEIMINGTPEGIYSFIEYAKRLGEVTESIDVTTLDDKH